MKIISINPNVMWEEDHFLRKPSRELLKEEVKSERFIRFIKVMFSSLYENPIGVGLAAPQLGVQVKAVVIDIKRNGKKPIVLINPTYFPLDDEMIDSTETCLSFPELAGTVKRFKRIKVIAKDLNFDDVEFESDSFLAIVCQHEIDHLNGQVYVDKAQEVYLHPNQYDDLADKAITSLSAST